MTAHAKPTAVPVTLLCTGLYIVKLDRPWIETPFLFQGFRIEGDEDLQLLREYCRRVYVDVRRSDRQAVETLRALASRRKRGTESQPDEPAPIAASGGRLAMPSARALKKSTGILFGDTVLPDRKGFRAQVQAAVARRKRVTRVVLEALRNARMGRSLDIEATRKAVERLAELVVADPTASLWVNQLREHNDREARHAVNTCILALAFGSYLGMKDRELRQLGMGALLHDIGKTRLPPRLLDKTKPLDEQDWDLLRRHPQYGHELLAAAGQVDREVLDMVRLHHERWQGAGYPNGLLGDAIPRTALIVGMLESYDAMTSEQPYRQAVSPEAALQTLHNGAAKTFGVELVENLIHCLGIFPVGTVVELDNGAYGVVVGSRPGGGIWPTVLLVRNPDGQPYRKRVLLNLLADARRKPGGGARRVRRGVEANEAGINVSEIVQQEFGVASAIAA